ncbi:hypothetical protein BAUCODRAFT_63556 [Baudoinia panamericana UAMH 10762]|uniref:tRNA (guanine(9)-N1)-methyltransferase n=1 Tax=Baudoinia panamericana (strain UAMH 10762) TaxID=717646 RepID=M2N7V3_BAUPA|nr:uncharacterized protein BAUCODRAFT_63556 [Baudoinia panamericana UAMH 10762]EMD00184.1 hypothetical protein BAUCODRAFT_63556 [Baudoinia panamericana UAMH 10762]
MQSDERPAKMRKLSHGSPSEDLAMSATARGLSDNGSLAHTAPGPSVSSTQDDNGDTTTDEQPPLSKNAQKRLRKKQEWEAKREDRKMIRKEKLIAKRERKREARQLNGESAPLPVTKKLKQQKPMQLPVTFLIDCDFDDLMKDNERISLAAQITRCYSDNKKSMFRAHLAACSFKGKLKERFDNVLTHYKEWRGVRFLDCDFVQAAEESATSMVDESRGGKLAASFSSYAELDDEAQGKLRTEGEVVYLTSEADDTLSELKPYSTYIIGGLVDKNREKGLCYKRAKQRGIKTARLPIGEFMEMQSRKVLATNHVNEIMLKWLECGDWGEAFVQVIPKRKGGKLKAASEQADDDEHADGVLDNNEDMPKDGVQSDLDPGAEGPELGLTSGANQANDDHANGVNYKDIDSSDHRPQPASGPDAERFAADAVSMG